MKLNFSIILIALALLLISCQPAEPACLSSISTPVFLTVPPDLIPTPTAAIGPYPVVIGRKEVLVDKVVEGPLCNDTWSGSVYVACNVQVYPWQESPTFLKDCQLTVEPNTVVYVAYHNNSAYYNGCSCHTGETPEP